ncbi:phosphatidylinositol-specific phospholipase C1-like protein [Sediminicola luteus]|uniref:Phosphoinositide phospholipase C, Ca2+-dependent n=1 Tax=Sediminicola luteus TaxID=319238 RepID=A0A2A4G494_9FLAO|nr:phosphatidylinositol-specific phospholipase C1-like protein [Sediminicola luteus]PCE62572.1 hypothetical protein B7P33_18220 [Sediminicola luteus]
MRTYFFRTVYLKRLTKGLHLFVLLVFFGCTQNQPPLKLNQIQLIGTHNSYKMHMDAAVMAQIKQLDGPLAQSLDYGHEKLTDQLHAGMRKLELDILYDPEGGRYSHPHGIVLQKAAGIPVVELDTLVMDKPGFKLLHVQDVDYRSTVPTFSLALKEINTWSEAHPNHLPIIIMINTKEDAVPGRPDLTVPLVFDDAAFLTLENEIAQVFGEKVITPDAVRGAYTTLNEAVLAGAWPTLEESKGRVLFIMLGGNGIGTRYAKGHPSLKNRMLFINAPEGSDEAAVIFKDDPIANQQEIQRLVKAGYLIRTRADADTEEARTGDYTKMEAAFASGAQIISTDYYKPDPRFKTGYKVSFSENKTFRVNPINGSTETALVE